MRRKFVKIALFLGIALAGWIYWKSNAEFNETPITINSNWNLINEVSLQPFPATCKRYTFLVILVTSYVGHVELRRAHRRANPAKELRKINATRIFLLAQIPEKEKKITQSAINEESQIFGDILQGTFIDNFRNLTYKHLVGLKWASTICQDATFILKVDDDTVYDLEKTYELLNSIDFKRNLVMGYIHYDAKPVRNKKSKWYVTWDEYPTQEYPEFLFGWYYITTPQVAAALCDEAIYHPYFWIDDIFVTGLVVEALGIELTKKPDEYLLDNFKNCHCCFVGLVGIKQFDCRHPIQ